MEEDTFQGFSLAMRADTFNQVRCNVITEELIPDCRGSPYRNLFPLKSETALKELRTNKITNFPKHSSYMWMAVTGRLYV
jgi:hypothetical protein